MNKLLTLALLGCLAVVATAQARIQVVGNQLGQVTIVKLWGTTNTGTAAMPKTAEEAEAIVREVKEDGNDLLRLHHVDVIAKTRGWQPVRWMADAGGKHGVRIIVTIRSQDPSPFGDNDFFRRMACSMSTTEPNAKLARDALLASLNAFLAAVGDHPAIAAIEPLNEEQGDPSTYGGFIDLIKTATAGKYSGLLLFNNAGVDSKWNTLAPKMGLISWHGYGDDAREGDPIGKYFSTLWSDQPWQWNATWAEAKTQPKGLLEVGSLFPNPHRMENELWLSAMAKVNGITSICWYLNSSGEWMNGPGPFLERYTSKEPMRAAAQFLGRYVFMDNSAVKRAEMGKDTAYDTDCVTIRTSGDPWGERKVKCIISADGLPIASSKRLFLTGGGVAQPTDWVSKPTQDDGKYLQIGSLGKLPFVVTGGGAVRFPNSNTLKAWYFDPLTRQRTGPALIQRVSPTDYTVWTGGGLLLEIAEA